MLREANGRALIEYVLDNTDFIPRKDTVIVVGYKKDMVIDRLSDEYTFVSQDEQKGTGHARQGQDRAPQMYHGGVAFGPVVRSHAYGLTKKVRALAMRMALSEKVLENKLFILDDMSAKKPSTKDFQKAFDANKWDSILFVGGEKLDENFALSARNIVNVDVLPAQGANVYDIVRRDVLVLSKDAVAQLEGRLK